MARWAAFAIFALASFTDWLDGHLARTWQQQSRFGAMLDPIADKLLVAAALLMLVADHTIAGAHVFAALIILSREILVSGLREFLATLNVKVAVTAPAKWKTAIQMIAIGLLIAGPALPLRLAVADRRQVSACSGSRPCLRSGQAAIIFAPPSTTPQATTGVEEPP